MKKKFRKFTVDCFRCMSSSLSTTFPGTATNLTALKDLVIFEERIRQNLENLRVLRALLWRRFITRFIIFIAVLFVCTRLRLIVVEGYPLVALNIFLLSLIAAVSGFTLIAAVAWRRAVDGRHYEEQCQKGLHPFNMQIRLIHTARKHNWLRNVIYPSAFYYSSTETSRDSDEITFLRRLPRPLAEFLEAYRCEYRARRALQMQPKKIS